ncbi:MAG: class I SAM-dependent methyltransferase [Betaproteobacteria bacterium]|nr:class I SAM-dependent methyltransferase [Betaproteobacteria bacterium]
MFNESSDNNLSQWLSTPLGQYLLKSEQACIDHEVADVFGFHSLQLGLPAVDFLRSNRIPYRHHLDPAGGAEINASFEALPLLSQSVDLVVMPHVLEFSSNPHEVLREVTRVLMPDGHLVITGFNPWSLWGLRQMLESNMARYPWCGDFINLPRLKDWTKLLGVELAAGRMRCYLPPVRREEWLQRFGFLDAAGDRWWPFMGGVYVLHGIKRVHGMRLIMPKWKRSVLKSKALAAVPRRVGGASMTQKDAPERNR